MNWRNVYDCYFYAFQQKWKVIQKKKSRNNREIWQKGVCRREGCTSRQRKDIGCRIRHMIVRYFASEWCMTSLFQKGKIYGIWSFSLSSTVSSCTTKPPSSPFWFDNAVWGMLLIWCWFSGGEMTGKFRKVASHSAPEPAFGLFLNLPEGSAPWNPGTSMT